MKFGTCMDCEHYLAEDSHCKKFDCMALPDARCKSFQRRDYGKKVLDLAVAGHLKDLITDKLAYYMFKRLPEEEQVEIIAEILRDTINENKEKRKMERNGFNVLRFLRADTAGKLQCKLKNARKEGWKPANGALGKPRSYERGGDWWLVIERFHDFDKESKDND